MTPEVDEKLEGEAAAEEGKTKESKVKDILVELESRANTGYLRDAIAEIKELRRRRDDLLAANSLEVEKRRAAENSLVSARIELGAMIKALRLEAVQATLNSSDWIEGDGFNNVQKLAEHLICTLSASRTEHSSWTQAEREFEQHVSRNPKMAKQPANT